LLHVALGGGLLHLLFVPNSLPLKHLLIEKGFYANTSSFRTEMPTKGICAGKAPGTTPRSTSLEITLADKLFVARMQPFVALAVVLARKGLAAHCAYERPLVRVGTEVGP
jgi:hypothetical protein